MGWGSNSLLENRTNNVVALKDGKVAVIEGLDGFLIAESKNVLLICPKDEEHTFRKYVTDAQVKAGEDFV